MHEHSFPESDSFAGKPEIRATFGETLPDGSIIELVMVDGRLMLCYSDGTHHVVLPSFDFGNITFVPPCLARSLQRALTFPGPPAESSGSMTTLFEDATAVFQQRGFSDEAAHWGGLFSLVSWLPEFFPNPPTLVAYGRDMQQAALFFTLMTCTCRRAFFAAQLCRSLPFSLQPTLLILAGDTSARAHAFWRACNFNNVYLPSRAGGVENVACARALFVQDYDALERFGEESWRLPLLPNERLSRVTEHERAEIARELLPRMLGFRLHRLTQAKRSDAPGGQRQFAGTGISRHVLMLVQSEDKVADTIAPLIQAQEAEYSERQKRDPFRAIVEALWHASHQEKRMSLEQLTSRVNALLYARGEMISLDERQIGWRCRQLGLNRERNNEGMFLRFSADMRCTLHRLALRFDLQLARQKGCRYCN